MISPSTPARPGVGEKSVDAIDVDRIVVAHQHQRRGVVALTKAAHHFKRLLQGHAGVERAQAGGLDRRAVCHRVGEGHADLDDVGARLRQRPDDRRARLPDRDRRPSGRSPSAARPSRLQLGEAGVDAGGHSSSARQNFRDLRNVLVAAAGEIDDHQMIFRPLRRELRHLGECMRGFQRRQDAFQPRQQLKRGKRLSSVADR